MRTKILLVLTFLFFMSDEIKAQIVSPEVDGNKVTFRLRAANAKKVSVVGVEGKPPLDLSPQENGLWVGSVEGLKPELYSYAFEIDGTRVTDPSNRMVKKWLSCNSMFEIRGGLLHEEMDVPHGTVQEIYYQSEAVGRQRKALVYLPPKYQASAEPYPVLYLLHGYGDDYLAWKEVGRANLIIDNLIHQEKIEPCVVVMPYGHPIPIDLRKEFDDYASTNADSMNKDLMKSLLPEIEKRYRVSTKRDQRGIVGLSMGGGQSIHIGLNNLDHFSRVGGFSSAAPQGKDEKIDQDFPQLQSEDTGKKIDLFWIACGKDDFLFDRNNRFVDWMKKKDIKHQYLVSEGGHDWMVWRKYLAQFLQKAFPAK